jgi:hypothetical protein
MFSVPCSAGNAQPVLMFRLTRGAKVRNGTRSALQGCLRENKSKLSEPCRKVVEAHGG